MCVLIRGVLDTKVFVRRGNTFLSETKTRERRQLCPLLQILSVLHEKEFLFVFTGADTTGIGLEIDFCSTFKIKSKNKNWIKIRHSNIKYQKLAPGNGAVEMMR